MAVGVSELLPLTWCLWSVLAYQHAGHGGVVGAVLTMAKGVTLGLQVAHLVGCVAA